MSRLKSQLDNIRSEVAHVVTVAPGGGNLLVLAQSLLDLTDALSTVVDMVHSPGAEQVELATRPDPPFPAQDSPVEAPSGPVAPVDALYAYLSSLGAMGEALSATDIGVVVADIRENRYDIQQAYRTWMLWANELGFDVPADMGASPEMQASWLAIYGLAFVPNVWKAE